MSDAAANEPAWVGDVLDFWFRELGAKSWFARSDEIDETIRVRFLEVHQRVASAGGFDVTAPREMLAAVIVLDQFSRNMFRGTPRAFASDAVARGLARQAIAQGSDRSMTHDERLFLYLPFEHSEDRDDQALSVRLIGELGNDDLSRYAVAHQSIIERFGRFPHRNAILGRASTEEELALLQDPMGSF
jgi:uncharacterized protein (DUF924 family)